MQSRNAAAYCRLRRLANEDEGVGGRENRIDGVSRANPSKMFDRTHPHRFAINASFTDLLFQAMAER